MELYPHALNMVDQFGILNVSKYSEINRVWQEQIIEVFEDLIEHVQRQPFALQSQVDIRTVPKITFCPRTIQDGLIHLLVAFENGADALDR